MIRWVDSLELAIRRRGMKLSENRNRRYIYEIEKQYDSDREKERWLRARDGSLQYPFPE